MIGKWLQAMDQWQIAELEEIRRFAEITIDQFLHTQMIVTMTFLHVTQKTRETIWLEGFQLFTHGSHIRRQRQFTAIVEDQMIGWVYALKCQHFTHGYTQGSELRFI